MNPKIEKLRDWGCDIEGAMIRMVDDEEFYLECLNCILDDKYFSELGFALKSHDTPVAFDSAHTLKGILANVGLTPMYNKIVEIVEPLREGRDSDLLKKYEELEKMKAYLSDILK